MKNKQWESAMQMMQKTALEMKQLIQAELHAKDVLITDIGAVIGSHTGPGTIAIFFLNESPLTNHCRAIT